MPCSVEVKEALLANAFMRSYRSAFLFVIKSTAEIVYYQDDLTDLKKKLLTWRLRYMA